ncbi:HEAT repeat domain-containing protein [Cecembia rubra]|uniref:HEAT repeat protein n=1 Tax=Cecembia rubra TaxID=1485585 RepID=A0A2P8EEK7_9BACT|nr:HEAT repeat domain-containing protein [Cecembia rubra]PSL07899.1 hypothetical protein CLV48_101838 [Cecembia rubra]
MSEFLSLMTKWDSFVQFGEGGQHYVFAGLSDLAILILSLSVCVVIVYLLYIRSVKLFREKIKKLVQYKINGFFSELIFSDGQMESDYDEKINEFKKKVPLHKDWCKDLLIQNIIDLDKNLKGQSKELLLSVFFKLDLLGYTEKLVNSSTWYYKTKGISYWKELNYSNAAEKIYPLIFHDNHYIRSSALIAYISLSEVNPLNVLEEYGDSITYIESLNLMEVIQRRKIKKPKNLVNWLKFEEESKLIFALKLVAYYNDLDAAGAVVQTLESPNSKVRHEAIRCIGKLYYFDAEQDLISMFFNEPEENQVEIIRALKEIGSQDSVDFLHYILGLNKGSEIKINAMYALKSLDAGFIKNEIQNNKELELVRKHVKNPYLEV